MFASRQNSGSAASPGQSTLPGSLGLESGLINPDGPTLEKFRPKIRGMVKKDLVSSSA